MSIGRETDVNATALSDEFLLTCGVNYCPESSSTEDANNTNNVTESNFKTTDTQIYTLAGIFLACSILSPIVISALVDPLTR